MKVGDLVMVKPHARWGGDPYFIGIIISNDDRRGYAPGLFFVVFADGLTGDYWPEDLEVLYEKR